MDYSIHDAIEAGFNHVVFIIRKDIEKEFKEVIGDRIASICSSHTLNGTLYPDEQVVIYDIGDVKLEIEKKRRGRRKKSEIEAEQKEN